jgi:hypothetical protein
MMKLSNLLYIIVLPLVSCVLVKDSASHGLSNALWHAINGDPAYVKILSQGSDEFERDQSVWVHASVKKKVVEVSMGQTLWAEGVLDEPDTRLTQEQVDKISQIVRKKSEETCKGYKLRFFIYRKGVKHKIIQ